MTKALDLRNIRVQYGDFVAAQDVSLTLAAGDIGCLLGPSGCGKTSVLRAIAGFEPLAAGEIWLGEHCLGNTHNHLPPEQRNIGMLFQDFALFPHLTVARNVGFGLRKMAKKQRQARVHELLALVGLEGRARAYPHQLSGGQQQRVALARALATEPDLLLLDEPFSSLDSELRTQLAVEIRELLKRTGTTAVLVTHDQREAFALADHITLLRNGQVEQSGSATTLYHQPASRFAATFIGEGHIINTSVDNDGKLSQELASLGQTEWPPGPIQLLIRPEHVTYREGGTLQPTVLSRTFQGAQTQYLLQFHDGQQLSCLTSGQVDITPGKPLPVDIDLNKLIPLNGK